MPLKFSRTAVEPSRSSSVYRERERERIKEKEIDKQRDREKEKERAKVIKQKEDNDNRNVLDEKKVEFSLKEKVRANINRKRFEEEKEKYDLNSNDKRGYFDNDNKNDDDDDDRDMKNENKSGNEEENENDIQNVSRAVSNVSSSYFQSNVGRSSLHLHSRNLCRNSIINESSFSENNKTNVGENNASFNCSHDFLPIQSKNDDNCDNDGNHDNNNNNDNNNNDNKKKNNNDDNKNDYNNVISVDKNNNKFDYVNCLDNKSKDDEKNNKIKLDNNTNSANNKKNCNINIGKNRNDNIGNNCVNHNIEDNTDQHDRKNNNNNNNTSSDNKTNYDTKLNINKENEFRISESPNRNKNICSREKFINNINSDYNINPIKSSRSFSLPIHCYLNENKNRIKDLKNSKLSKSFISPSYFTLQEIYQKSKVKIKVKIKRKESIEFEIMNRYDIKSKRKNNFTAEREKNKIGNLNLNEKKNEKIDQKISVGKLMKNHLKLFSRFDPTLPGLGVITRSRGDDFSTKIPYSKSTFNYNRSNNNNNNNNNNDNNNNNNNNNNFNKNDNNNDNNINHKNVNNINSNEKSNNVYNKHAKKENSDNTIENIINNYNLSTSGRKNIFDENRMEEKNIFGRSLPRNNYYANKMRTTTSIRTSQSLNSSLTTPLSLSQISIKSIYPSMGRTIGSNSMRDLIIPDKWGRNRTPVALISTSSSTSTSYSRDAVLGSGDVSSKRERSLIGRGIGGVGGGGVGVGARGRNRERGTGLGSGTGLGTGLDVPYNKSRTLISIENRYLTRSYNRFAALSSSTAAIPALPEASAAAPVISKASAVIPALPGSSIGIPALPGASESAQDHVDDVKRVSNGQKKGRVMSQECSFLTLQQWDDDIEIEEDDNDQDMPVPVIGKHSSAVEGGHGVEVAVEEKDFNRVNYEGGEGGKEKEKVKKQYECDEGMAKNSGKKEEIGTTAQGVEDAFDRENRSDRVKDINEDRGGGGDGSIGTEFDRVVDDEEEDKTKAALMFQFKTVQSRFIAEDVLRGCTHPVERMRAPPLLGCEGEVRSNINGRSSFNSALPSLPISLPLPLSSSFSVSLSPPLSLPLPLSSYVSSPISLPLPLPLPLLSFSFLSTMNLYEDVAQEVIQIPSILCDDTFATAVGDLVKDIDESVLDFSVGESTVIYDCTGNYESMSFDDLAGEGFIHSVRKAVRSPMLIAGCQDKNANNNILDEYSESVYGSGSRSVSEDVHDAVLERTHEGSGMRVKNECVSIVLEHTQREECGEEEKNGEEKREEKKGEEDEKEGREKEGRDANDNDVNDNYQTNDHSDSDQTIQNKIEYTTVNSDNNNDDNNDNNNDDNIDENNDDNNGVLIHNENNVNDDKSNDKYNNDIYNDDDINCSNDNNRIKNDSNNEQRKDISNMKKKEDENENQTMNDILFVSEIKQYETVIDTGIATATVEETETETETETEYFDERFDKMYVHLGDSVDVSNDKNVNMNTNINKDRSEIISALSYSIDDLNELNNDDSSERILIRRNSIGMKNKNDSRIDNVNSVNNVNNSNDNVIINNKSNDQNKIQILNNSKSNRNTTKSLSSHQIFLNDFVFTNNSIEGIRTQDSFVKKMRSKTSNDNRDK